MSDNIKVVVKVRPLICREIEEKLFHQWRVKNNSLYQIDQNGKDCGNLFTFDKVYDETANTKDVYNDIAKPIVEASAAGFNGTIFAYGQTSSGKTYTMTGTEDSLGIIPLSVINLFDIIKNKPDRDFLVRVSYVEIYNETLIDLLNIEKKNIKIYDTMQGVKVDATVRVTTSPEEVFQFMKEGLANRQTGSTNMNEESSRSHSIFQITIESREQNIEGEEVGCLNISQLNLVDLAGSERSGQTGATGIRFKEGTHINKSLSSLALVIKQLSSEGLNKHVNYRDCKLTRILQNSLGGNAKTGIICAVTPAALEETISTLQFAYRAKAIKNNPEVNVVATDSKIIDSLTKQLSSLKTQLENKKNVEEDNQKLQKQIAALQRFLSGFGQHSRDEVMTGARRKNQQLRRATISTAELSQENELPNAPRFRTPSLKYNALSLARSEVNIEGMGGLAVVPEEPTRVVTPPPGNQRVTLNEEIINLDSDEDVSINMQTCSPYHKCIRECKTPPCILKKVARDAEKHLSEIIELTQLEKMYTPNVVELMEKLEKSGCVISKLEEEIELLNKHREETKTKMKDLLEKIDKNDEEVRNLNSAKLQLEIVCKDYNTKLTDWEVTYDTLRRKAKTREEELLSRLEELSNVKKNVVNNRLADTEESELATMNISIEKHNSPPSTSSINNDSTSQNIQDLILDLKKQLNVRDNTIFELEANLETKKQENLSLENKIQEVEKVSDSYKEKLINYEAENILHKSTIDKLNAMIEKQNDNLNSASIDIQSYSDRIQELQKVITEKESVLKLNDDEIENLIINEEKIIANNENIRNIIQSLQNILNKKNYEIEILKSTIQKNCGKCDNDESESKTQVIELIPKITELTIQLQDNQLEKEKLLLEKISLLNSLEELNHELLQCTKTNSELVKNNKNYESDMTKLKNINQELHNSLNEMKSLEIKLTSKDKEIKIMHKEMSAKHTTLVATNTELKAKNTEITAKNAELIATNTELTTKNMELITNNTELTSKNAELSVKMSELTEQNMALIAHNTETSAKNIELSQNNDTLALKNTEIHKELEEYVIKIDNLQHNLKLKDNKIESIIENHQKDNIICINKIKEVICNLQNILSVFTGENIDNPNLDGCSLLDIFKSINKKLDELRSYSTDTMSERNHFKMQNDQLCSKITIAGKLIIGQINSIYHDIHEVQGVIKEIIQEKILPGEDKLKDNIYEKCCTEKFDRLQQIHELTLFEDSTTLLEEMNVFITHFQQYISKFKLESISKIGDLSRVMRAKDLEIDEFIKEKQNLLAQLDMASRKIYSTIEQYDAMKIENDEIFTNIINNISKIAQVMNLKDIASDLENVDKKTFKNEHVISMMEKIVSQHLSSRKIEQISIIHKPQVDNSNVLIDLQELSSDSDLSKDLKMSTKLLDDLKEELKVKTCEIDSMKKKVLEWKDKFKDFETVMKKQQQDLLEENDKLKEICLQYDNAQKGTQSSTSKGEDIINTFNNEALQIIDISNSNHPKSLLTISCNKILEMLAQGCRTDSQSVTSISSRSNIDQDSYEYLVNCCECNKLKEKLKLTEEKNYLVINQCKDLKLTNKILMKEIQDASSEIKTLIKFSNELQKKIYSHKTNLSTLTAMTYAENKSLSSQVKFFQHHHTRFHTVCQRDIPELKKQLHVLKDLLKENNLECKVNVSLPIPLENNSILNNFKNESILDGDLLMLDTNITLATSANNTLTSHNQTCFESTQISLYSDAECQTSECCLNESPSHNLCTLHAEKFKSLENENEKMKQLIQSKNTKEFNMSSIEEDSKIDREKSNDCNNCKDQKVHCQQLIKELEVINLKLTEIVSQKDAIEKKYNNLSLEVPSTDALLRKLHNFERELENKGKDIEKLRATLKKTEERLKSVQDENDNLSTQVIESITEVDDLKLELDTIRKKYLKNDNDTKNYADVAHHEACQECVNKDDFIKVLQNKCSNTHTHLNRSYSDSDSSSRYNKICTLQIELDAGREDCKELKEEVTTIKNHLESSNLSIDQAITDLDKSIDSSSKDANSQTEKSFMPKICEENVSDIYTLDKLECRNYYFEKIGDEKSNIHGDIKIIEVMKMLYTELMIKHENQIENLINKLRDYEDSKLELQEKIDSISKEKEESNCNIQNIETKLLALKNKIDILNKATSVLSKEDSANAIELFKTEILKVLDLEFSMNSLPLFETIYNRVIDNLNETIVDYFKLKVRSSALENELEIVNNHFIQLKELLSVKENECNLLIAQKTKIHEISDTVTMDLVRKEQDLSAAITEGYRKLAEENILVSEDVNVTLSPIKNLHLLFNRLVNKSNLKSVLDRDKEIEVLKQYLIDNKSLIEQKNKEMHDLSDKFEYIKRLNADLNIQLHDKDEKLLQQKSLLEELNVVYNKKVEENDLNRTIVQNLTEEVGMLKEFNAKKDIIIRNFEENLIERHQEIDDLKRFNDGLCREKEFMSKELEKSEATIKQNKMDLDQMQSDIETLKGSLKVNNEIIDSLKMEVTSLSVQNSQLKEEKDEKIKELVRLEFNIKTHETTAAIQTKMISRLKKQNEKDNNVIAEKEKQLHDVNQKYSTLQNESVGLKDCIAGLRHEIDTLISVKHSLEDKISHLESEQSNNRRSRSSMESVMDISRRRRQSIHDSKRIFGDKQDNINMDDMTVGCSKLNDSAMDVDENNSCRSTPIRHSKGRDSLHSKHEESEEEGRSSRCSSVLASRQRRQSIHDLHRSSLQTTPEKHVSDNVCNRSRTDSKKDISSGDNLNSQVKELQDRLSSCQQELEEFKEKCKELDEECEMCAEYLRERDEQCLRLKKDKIVLEKKIIELNEKLQHGQSNAQTGRSSLRIDCANVAVNTDEDWTNLHSVVVDRMSYDAEVDKNKKLMKVIEELRFQKQEQKTVISKMQRVLEENSSKDVKELERTRKELRSCKEELVTLKMRITELDEECETCAQYLRDRDEQCRKLKDTVAVLEAKVNELQENSNNITQSVRKKRQTQHDLHRMPAEERVEACTQITEDFLSSQVERDNTQPVTNEVQIKQIKQLKLSVEKLSEQKAALEQQLMAATTAPVYVATGSAIVQNQQISDVMKENRKLKKINAKLVSLCGMRGKPLLKSNLENQDPADPPEM